MEHQYLNLLHNLLTKGERRDTRSGTVYSSFGHHLEFDLTKGFPLLTTKKMFFVEMYKIVHLPGCNF